VKNTVRIALRACLAGSQLFLPSAYAADYGTPPPLQNFNQEWD
jgi:hypothetical protein